MTVKVTSTKYTKRKTFLLYNKTLFGTRKCRGTRGKFRSKVSELQEDNGGNVSRSRREEFGVYLQELPAGMYMQRL